VSVGANEGTLLRAAVGQESWRIGHLQTIAAHCLSAFGSRKQKSRSKGANARGVFRCVRGLQGPAVRQPAPAVAFAAGAVATCGALRRDEVVAILGGMDIRRN